MEARGARRAAWLAGGIAFAIYLATNQPYVHAGDPGEFQTLASVGGIAHAGYVPVVLLLQLFGHLPISTMAFRANLLSCVAGATAVGFAAFVATRLCGNWLAALAAALAFALGRTPWKESTEASVHAPALALDAILLFLTLRFANRPDRRGAFFIGLVGGLAALSHLSASSLAPVILAVGIVAARQRRLRMSQVVAAAGGLALGLSAIGYMLVVDQPNRPMNYIEDVLRLEPAEFIPHGPVPQTRIARTAWLLSGRQYFGYAHPPGWKPDSRLRRGVELATEVGLNQCPLWGFPLALLGAWALWKRRARGAWIIGAWFASDLLLTNSAASGWIASYFFLPGLWTLSIAIAAGLDEVGRRWKRPAFALAAVLVVTAPIVRLSIPRPPGPLGRYTLTSVTWSLWPKEWSPLRIDRSWDDYGRQVMRTLPQRAAVMTWWAEGNVLRYFCYGEPLRSDVRVVLTGTHPVRVGRAVALEEAEGRPVFATFPPDARTPRDLEFIPVARLPLTGLWRVVSDSTKRNPARSAAPSP
ncbi:MAG TPA: DUF2723 domain-containing protein [Candidatus Udaeobacter sp.]|jgi:hypothetical protein|nr:DUF2723 domain-containing protein [Candidatus Udaeobacter sp.]